ncbi:calpain-8-like [Rhinatrema bivittatum]|uniref:calpain-8-like n=1 Tax=Rhinatrema bivittatum TaxID=194408 RepID=UPI001127B83E|nr:calpain-8-like [Rhinatrema bivittatum]
MSGIIAKMVKSRAVSEEGLGTNDNAVKYLNQDFEALREQCLQSGNLFKDEEFPACPSALGYQKLGPNSPDTQGIVWKRPTDLSPDPQFIVGGATRTDIRQGALGDCWLLAAIASLTLDQDILSRVVPENQSFQENYAGIFHFQFWQYGEWEDVVVDDRLPTKNGQLVFVHSEAGNEFWSALLEKAYAKLNGSYEALTGGSTIEGFEDFTGGISEPYDLKKAPADLFQVIQKALKVESLLGCSIDITSAYETEDITRQKLVKGHAYSLTGAQEVNYRGRTEKLVRIRNPWGEVEWTGAWSDNAPEWNFVDPEVKEALDKQCDDGEFWMSYSDFSKQFSRLEICNLTPDTLTCTEQHKWNTTLFSGHWRRGCTAGGCQNYPTTFWTNPQFKIVLNEPDHDHEGSEQEPCCTVVVGLMQKNRRRRRRTGDDLLSIGYTLYRIPKELENHTDVHMNRDFFSRAPSAARSDTYINMREVSKRIRLPVGEYLIVPTTFEPFKDGEFCLRVFSEKQASALEIGDVAKGNPYEPKISDEGVDQHFKHLFEQLTGEDSEMTATELQTLLNRVVAKRTDIKSDGFTLFTCREMISLLDIEGTGTLGLVEFKILWMKIQKYMEIYKRVDTDRSGTIDAHEIRSGLREAGFSLNNKVLHIIIMRYASSDLLIDFDSFVACMIRLETVFKMFQLLDKGNSGEINLSLPEWLCCTLV